MEAQKKYDQLISDKMEAALNKQLELESRAHFKYLAVASWCEREGLDGAASFFYKHATEEHAHFMKFFAYILEVNGHAITPAVDKPKNEFKDIPEVVNYSLQNELEVTEAIHKMVDLAVEERDHITYDFLQFFVDEQREEVVLFTKVLDRIRIIGDGPQKLYYIDQELAKMAAEHE